MSAETAKSSPPTTLEYHEFEPPKRILGISRKWWFASTVLWAAAGLFGYSLTKSRMQEHDVYCYVVIGAFFATSLLFTILKRS